MNTWNQPEKEAAEKLSKMTDKFIVGLHRARESTDVSPSEKTIANGNYRKGRIRARGQEIAIENPLGSVRSGKDSKGNTWETTMRSDYGYFKGTQAWDGDSVDVFIGKDPENEKIWVIDQQDENGKYDEPKVILGEPDIQSAKKLYLSNYKKDWDGIGAITELSDDAFKEWLKNKPSGPLSKKFRNKEKQSSWDQYPETRWSFPVKQANSSPSSVRLQNGYQTRYQSTQDEDGNWTTQRTNYQPAGNSNSANQSGTQSGAHSGQNKEHNAWEESGETLVNLGSNAYGPLGVGRAVLEGGGWLAEQAGKTWVDRKYHWDKLTTGQGNPEDIHSDDYAQTPLVTENGYDDVYGDTVKEKGLLGDATTGVGRGMQRWGRGMDYLFGSKEGPGDRNYTTAPDERGVEITNPTNSNFSPSARSNSVNSNSLAGNTGSGSYLQREFTKRSADSKPTIGQRWFSDMPSTEGSFLERAGGLKGLGKLTWDHTKNVGSRAGDIAGEDVNTAGLLVERLTGIKPNLKIYEDPEMGDVEMSDKGIWRNTMNDLFFKGAPTSEEIEQGNVPSMGNDLYDNIRNNKWLADNRWVTDNPVTQYASAAFGNLHSFKESLSHMWNKWVGDEQT